MSNQASTSFQDKVAIVTGGASGIGKATCRALARSGAKVVAIDVNPQQLDEAVAELAQLAAGQARCLGLVLDVGNESDMQRMADVTLERYGRIDMLVACAGILRARGTSLKPLAQVAVEEWDQVLDINLKGMFLSNRAVLSAMLKQRRGDIINVSSVSGRQGRPFDGPYCASKFGVIGLSESLSEEVRGAGVRVQVVVPDAVNTPIWQQNGPVPMPANALPPERVADVIMFMLALPPDAMLVAPIIAPSRARSRGAGKKGDTHSEEKMPT